MLSFVDYYFITGGKVSVIDIIFLKPLEHLRGMNRDDILGWRAAAEANDDG